MLNIINHREMQIKTTVRYHLIPVKNGCYEKDKIASVGEVNSLQQRFFDLDVMGNSTEDPYNVKQK